MRASATQLARSLYVSLAASAPAAQPELIRAFLKKLALARRGAWRSRILDAFTNLALAAEGKSRGTVRTASELTPAMRASLQKSKSATSFEFAVDPSLVGGASVQVADAVLDGSVQGRLNELKKALVG